ncbi:MULTISPECIES: hypothetical protein [Streptomyces]|uniref:DUF4267 domain-containing protein n=1 Tax=Streptomyces doudnae TaxID=3075536 RepID=A0ABD5EFN8_9ACTN|nr:MULTISPECIES: hypothetical protein [unclassified Streptomyces]MDT0433401.1 hypothetical protein [Streptomyces sp. DSM 41981]MYQ66834.1 hypothetical protein [Streptomyces sp. SID4950]SCE25976.1 hypothetical protein GA0115242_127233 [Streptomyces sp. SolWspMP-5a-2]
MTVLLVANTVAAVAGIVFAVLGGVRPASLSDSGTPSGGERFYGWMYAVRGVPLGVAAAVAPLAWTGPAVTLVLLAAAAAQVGDAAIGVTHRKWTMIAGASVATALHVATAVAVA